MSAASGTTERLRRGWDYYRRYTRRRAGIHAAATAALTGLGLLAYFERWFVAIAIAAYLLPPVYLYLTGDDLTVGDQSSGGDGDANAQWSRTDSIDADSDADGTGVDTDFDGIDGDADADGADADADGIDADADADGVDADFDG